MNAIRSLHRLIAVLLVVFTASARAEMIGTREAISAADRSRIMSVLHRPEVEQYLRAGGIAPQDAVARVAAMSDEEVQVVNEQLDSLPAGSNAEGTLLLGIAIVGVIVFLLANLIKCAHDKADGKACSWHWY